MKATVKHIFFDLDHTLWDFETNSTLTLKELFERFDLGVKIDSEDAFVKRYKEINAHYWSLYRVGQIKKSELRNIRFEKTLEHFGFSDPDLTNTLSEEYVSTCPLKPNLMPGCIEVLDYLYERYDLHIITNGFEEIQAIKLQKSGIDKYFQHVVTSEKIDRRKPDPVIFNHAGNLTSSSGTENLMIGDHYEADVLGARAVGWHAIHFDPENTHIEPDDLRISALISLKDHL